MVCAKQLMYLSTAICTLIPLGLLLKVSPGPLRPSYPSHTILCNCVVYLAGYMYVAAACMGYPCGSPTGQYCDSQALAFEIWSCTMKCLEFCFVMDLITYSCCFGPFCDFPLSLLSELSKCLPPCGISL